MWLLFAAFSSSVLEVDPSTELSFIHWMRANSVFYTGSEYFLRLGVFLTNSRFASEFNKRHTFRVAMNRFACTTPSEYRALLNRRRPLAPMKHAIPFQPSRRSAGESIDWRTKGVVTPIKDQGNCASGWAFATAQAQESAIAIASQDLCDISSSNLIDCATYCDGCSGGFSYQAFDYVIDHQNGLFMRLADYPDTQAQGSCQFNAEKGFAAVSGYTVSCDGDERALVAMCNSGVLAVSVDASLNSFMLYQSGIYSDEQCSRILPNAQVGVVGYGTADQDYWIIRNSVGTAWGEDGYMRMLRGSNMCGIAELAIAVV